VVGDETADLVGKYLEVSAAVGHCLAPHQIQRLDTVGTFIDLGDANVTYQLLLTPLADVATATENLLAVNTVLEPDIGEKGLGDRRQQGYQILARAADRLVLGKLADIQLHAHIGGERPAALGHGLHGQQHAAHIRVHDDGVGGLVRLHRTGRRTALDTFAGVGHSALVGGLGAADTLNANGQALIVHHGEHGVEPLVQLTDEIAPGAIEVH